MISNDAIRVRFAPSPTGFVHVGSLRTALYNYLFARRLGGKFILRIEDTDQTRYVEGAVGNLIATLLWAGLGYDEGPEAGGSFGPYFQSQRLDIYREHARQLLQNGSAYPCFCSAERLEQMRRDQAAKGETQMYDGFCRHIPQDEALRRMKEETHVIRLRAPQEGESVVDDIVRGRVAFQNNLIDDQVLIKSDGFPTYHMANVVDDHLMQISHVIRGEEWLPSAPKHLLLYQAFGWMPPQFAHLPLLLNPDRSKLSKRQGDVAVEDYRAKGILPQSLLNFVALLGWSKGDDQELLTLAELIEHFSLERVNKSGAVFDLHKLDWMNGHYIRSISEEEYFLIGLDWMNREQLDAGSATLNREILKAVRPSLNRFNELTDRCALFFHDRQTYSDEAREWIIKPESRNIFQKMIEYLQPVPELTTDIFRQVMKDIQKVTGVKGQELWMPVRAAITGVTHGPELPVVLSVIGKEKTLRFLQQAIEL
jgi:glutamyl-tRNA synthetase